MRERQHWELIGPGIGIHWPMLDEDISLDGLLRGLPSGESAESFERWLASRGDERLQATKARSTKPMPLDRKQRVPYVLEVQELARTLLGRFDELQRVAASWVKNDESADLQLQDETSIDIGPLCGPTREFCTPCATAIAV
jgi:hypothetical protein